MAEKTFTAAKESNFTQAMDENITSADVIGSEIEVTHKSNCKFELHIGRNMFTFMGQETHLFSKKLLKHKDWTPETAKYFMVKEVK